MKTSTVTAYKLIFKHYLIMIEKTAANGYGDFGRRVAVRPIERSEDVISDMNLTVQIPNLKKMLDLDYNVQFPLFVLYDSSLTPLHHILV